MGLVPKQTKADVRINRFFTKSRIIGIMLASMISFIFSIAVHRYLKIPFMIFVIITYFILDSKAPSNPTKKFWQGLIEFYKYIFSKKNYSGKYSNQYLISQTLEAQKNERKAENPVRKRFNLIIDRLQVRRK